MLRKKFIYLLIEIYNVQINAMLDIVILGIIQLYPSKILAGVLR